ncbi:MAG: thiamine biosynthesis protein [Myxococcales bacterium]|nr:thiamine biosynthesis protein [Myxococcales bacterium]
MNARGLYASALTLGAFVLCSCVVAHAAERHLVRRGFQAMGTEISFAVLATDEERAARAIDDAFAEIKRLENMMTTWRDDSEVSRINHEAGVAPVVVSPETLEVIEASQKASKLSGGAFDITFYAMHGLWKFDDDLEAKVPPADQIKKRLPLIDYRKLIVDHQKRTVFLSKKGMGINLGGIAKGYAVDRAVDVLRKAGFSDAIVQAGGDLMCSGSKNGQPWVTGIRDPRAERSAVFAKMMLENHAFSTAGDYERFFILDGKRYHHIIDPRTGYPATRSRSVTIYAPNALLADAVDDAVFILGWQKGFEMIDKLDDVGAVVVDDKGKVHVSKRVQERVHIDYEPKDAP